MLHQLPGWQVIGGIEKWLKALYLRIVELYKKWNGRPVSNWALVRNQLSMDDKIQKRIMKYEVFYE